MTILERLSVVVPADWVPGPQQGEWTYADYAAIAEDGHRYRDTSFSHSAGFAGEG